MIHPINLPEEFLAVNPTRPSLIELRQKPRITYTSDGRRLRNGLPTSLRSQNSLWSSTFVRGFIHQMTYVARTETEKTSSTNSLIDIVDLQPPAESMVKSEVQHEKFKFEKDRALLAVEDSCIPDRADSLADDQDQDEKKLTGILDQSLPQFKKTTRSSIVDHDAFSPILQPCCSSAELKRFPLKKFLQLDFSNVAFFYVKATTEDQAAEPSQFSISRSSTSFVPQSIMWVNELINLRLSSHTQLCFAIKIEPTTLVIIMTARNNHQQAINRQTAVYVHVAHGRCINSLTLS